jgi:hypothetical protein
MSRPKSPPGTQARWTTHEQTRAFARSIIVVDWTLKAGGLFVGKDPAPPNTMGVRIGSRSESYDITAPIAPNLTPPLEIHLAVSAHLVEVAGGVLPRIGNAMCRHCSGFSYYGFGSKRARRMSLAPGQLGQRSRKVAYRKLGRFTGTTSVPADRRGRLETTSSRKG